MKCQITSSKTHDVLISKEIRWKSYKEICSGEPKKVNLGYNNNFNILKVENNTLIPEPPIGKNMDMNGIYKPMFYGQVSGLSWDWEVLSKFFSNHNIEPNWLDCNETWGWFDEDQGEWTGFLGKV